MQIVEMIECGWIDIEINDLMGGNLMCVMDEVDVVSVLFKDEKLFIVVWEKRKDLFVKWGGEGDVFYLYVV